MLPLMAIKLTQVVQQDNLASAERSGVAARARRRRRTRPGRWSWPLRRSSRANRLASPASAGSRVGVRLAERIAEEGLGGLEVELARFCRQACERGANPALLAIVLDAGAPDVLRQRAFGKIEAELDASRRRASSDACDGIRRAS